MRKRRLDMLNRDASVLCLGTAYFGTDIPESLSFEMLDAFTEMGGNFLDTARLYGFFDEGITGVSEALLGRWMSLRHNRDKIVLATKGGHPEMHAMDRGRLDPDSLRRDLSESLEALKTNCTDLYWLHRDDESRPVEGIVDTLNGFLADGRVRAIGASNWLPARLLAANEYARRAGLTGFQADQPQWALAHQVVLEDKTIYRMDEALYALHSRSGLPCVPFSSQAQGFFTKLDKLGPEGLSGKLRTRYLYDTNLARYEAAKEIARRKGIGIGAVCLSFLTSQPFPVFPIVGASSMEQLLSFKEAGDAILSREETASLTHLSGLR